MSSSQQFKAGQAHGQGMEKADQWVHSATDTTHEAARENKEHTTGMMQQVKADQWVHSATDTTHEAARENKEHTTGMMQQVGEQARNMAHNAVESMKHTLGVDKNHK